MTIEYKEKIMNENIWSNPAFLPLLGVLFGGVGLAIVNKWLGRNKEKFDLGTLIRDEIRKDNLSYRNEIDELTRRVESWQIKYYEMDQAHKKKINELQDEMERMRRILIKNGIDYPPLK